MSHIYDFPREFSNDGFIRRRNRSKEGAVDKALILHFFTEALRCLDIAIDEVQQRRVAHAFLHRAHFLHVSDAHLQGRIYLRNLVTQGLCLRLHLLRKLPFLDGTVLVA